MAEKLILDLSLVLPDAADECEDWIARLCLHYNPEQFSVSRVRELAKAAGARIGNRYRHESQRIDGMDWPTASPWI